MEKVIEKICEIALLAGAAAYIIQLFYNILQIVSMW